MVILSAQKYSDTRYFLLQSILRTQETVTASFKRCGYLGNFVPLANLSVRVNVSGVLQYQLNNPMPGTWFAKYNSAAPCLFVASANTSLAISGGFVAGNKAIHSDNPSTNTSVGVPTYYVAHASGLPCPGKIQFLEVFQGPNVVFQSMAQTRYHCGYEKFFGVITCNQAGYYLYQVWNAKGKKSRPQLTSQSAILARPTRENLGRSHF